MSIVTTYFSITENKFLNLLSFGLKDPQSINFKTMFDYYKLKLLNTNATPNFYVIAIYEINNYKEKIYCEFFINMFDEINDLKKILDDLTEIIKKDFSTDEIDLVDYIYGYVEDQSPYELQIIFFNYILNNITTRSKTNH